MAFPATDAALEGFKITRARPQAILAWTAVQLVLVALLRAALVGLLGPQWDSFANLNPLSPLPTSEIIRLMPVAFEFLAANLVLWILANGLLYAAVNRAVMRPSEGGWGWLRFGMDELRQMAVLFCYTLVLLAAYLGGAMVVQLLAILLMAALGAPGAVLTLLVGLPAILALVVWVGVRLSLAPPATFDRGRFVLFDTWSLTRGRFWPLLGAYIISWLLSLLVTVLVLAFIGNALASVIGGPPETKVMTLQTLFSPRSIVELLFAGLAGGLTTPVTLAPAAYAYRELSGSRSAAAAFS